MLKSPKFSAMLLRDRYFNKLLGDVWKPFMPSNNVKTIPKHERMKSQTAEGTYRPGYLES